MLHVMLSVENIVEWSKELTLFTFSDTSLNCMMFECSFLEDF